MFSTTETKTGFAKAIGDSARADFMAAAWGVCHMLAAEAEEMPVSEAKATLKTLAMKAGFVDRNDKSKPSAKAKHILATISGGYSRFAKTVNPDASAEDNAMAVYTAMTDKFKAKTGDCPSFAAMFKTYAGKTGGKGKSAKPKPKATETETETDAKITVTPETVKVKATSRLDAVLALLAEITEHNDLLTLAHAVNDRLIASTEALTGQPLAA